MKNILYIPVDFGALEVVFYPAKVKIDFDLLRSIAPIDEKERLNAFNLFEFQSQYNEPDVKQINFLIYADQLCKRTRKSKIMSVSGSEFLDLKITIINYQQANKTHFTDDQVRDEHYNIAFNLPF